MMRAFLGFSVYPSSFTENYAIFAAPLHDMTKNEFNWNEDTWTRDYRKDFEFFRKAMYDSMELVYPDFSLTWILLTDASDYAVGWVLIHFFRAIHK